MCAVINNSSIVCMTAPILIMNLLLQRALSAGLRGASAACSSMWRRARWRSLRRVGLLQLLLAGQPLLV